MTRFSLGKLVATPAAIEAMDVASIGPSALLARHVHVDWGDLSTADKKANDDALKDGSRIFSAYQLSTGERLRVITEACDDKNCRRSTCILKPADY